MRLTRLRVGELVVLLGVAGVVVALTLPWYESSEGKLSAWDTFGFGVVLLMLAAAVGLALVVATVTERSTALPVAAAVWSVLFGILAVVAAIVRLLERPHDAFSLCAGAWVALGGALLIAAGSWQSIRDERTSLYPPARPEPRDPPRA
jgi:peptidoglycan/LPS O-acetylase OafA/YrhL